MESSDSSEIPDKGGRHQMSPAFLQWQREIPANLNYTDTIVTLNLNMWEVLPRFIVEMLIIHHNTTHPIRPPPPPTSRFSQRCTDICAVLVHISYIPGFVDQNIR